MIAALPVLLGIIFLVLDHILTFGFYNGIKIIKSVLDTITGAKSKTSRSFLYNSNIRNSKKGG